MSVRLSLVWTYVAQALGFVITFGSSVVIARLVSPRDFGIFAMATAATTIINVLMQFGLAKFIMRETELTRDLLRSLFTVNVLMTLIYVISIVGSALLAGPIFGSNDVGHFLLIFALFPIFAMFEFIPEALCSREMRFGVISALQVVRAAVLAVSTILFAWHGYAYLSFAWAQVIAWSVTSICFNIIVWRPDVWWIRFDGTKRILSFGFQIIGMSGLAQLGARAGEVALGSLLGLANLGLYSRASNLPATVNANIFAGANVIFSRMSRDLREQGQIHTTYLRFTRMLLGLMWPMLAGIAVLSQPAIAIIYGEKWQAAAQPLAYLALATAILGIVGLASEVFILRHETARQVRIEAVRTVFGLTFFVGGAMISLPFAALGKLVEAVVVALLYLRPLARLVAGPPGAFRKMLGEALLLTVFAVFPALVLMVWNDFSPHTNLLHIVISVLLGVLLWGGILIHRDHPLAVEVGSLVSRLRRHS